MFYERDTLHIQDGRQPNPSLTSTKLSLPRNFKKRVKVHVIES